MLRKKIAVLLLSAAMAMTMLSGCGDNTAKEDKKQLQKIRIRMMLQKLRKKRQMKRRRHR